jgi:hypothetical protein
MTCNHEWLFTDQLWKRCRHCGMVMPTMATSKHDPVNRPAHYTHGSVEVFDMMLRIFGSEKVRIYCEINAFKYRMRAGYKGDAGEDIEKAKWYERKAKEI